MKVFLKVLSKNAVKMLILVICATFLIFWILSCQKSNQSILVAKPVIYLYPERTMDVDVNVLIKNGKISTTYPHIGDGWKVSAQPDGTLINYADEKEYSYLFWEASSKVEYDFSEGFVVKGEDTLTFLQEKLAYMGLTPREYNEFIVYWLPLMEGNEYNLISFQGDKYSDNAVLEIEPQPDSILRVFMAFKALDTKITVREQTLTTFNRDGFTVVEWGGAQVK